MKLQMIYNLYVNDDQCNNDIYRLHYLLLKKYTPNFDRVKIIITHNGNMYDDVIYRIRAVLVDVCDCNDVEIIYEQNNTEFREGIIFKKYVIDKMNEYDGWLTFFGHSKGVSNAYGHQHLDNLYKWIYIAWLLNFEYLYEVKAKLSGKYNGHDYISYGSLYFKDYRHNNINNWFYSGSFFWVNTEKLRKHIKENNIDISEFIKPEAERLKRCAELFLGYCFDSNRCAFHNDERFNKETNHFNMHGREISYEHIDLLIKQYLNVWEYDQMNVLYKRTLEELGI